FTGANCTFSPKQFKNFSVSYTKHTISLDMELQRPITRGFKSFLEYQLKMANAKTYQTIFTRVFDVCAAVTSLQDGLLKSWFKSMTEYGNFMQNCPVEVGTYYLHDWKFGTGMAHHFLHAGEYRSQMHFFYGKFRTKTEERVLSIILNTLLRN
ncbi:hypothetical protein KR222_006597, partial [Zaprionus bogoriensis]